MWCHICAVSISVDNMALLEFNFMVHFSLRVNVFSVLKVNTFKDLVPRAPGDELYKLPIAFVQILNF